MAFTDEDLRRLKEEVGDCDYYEGPIKGLIGRLEVAERVCGCVEMGETIDWRPFNTAYAEWLKASGR